jgi:hypothetical protein
MRITSCPYCCQINSKWLSLTPSIKTSEYKR